MSVELSSHRRPNNDRLQRGVSVDASLSACVFPHAEAISIRCIQVLMVGRSGFLGEDILAGAAARSTSKVLGLSWGFLPGC